MRVIETETGRLRFSDDDSRWPLLALTAGALGLCAVAIGGCAVDGAPGEASDPILICELCQDPSLIVYSLDDIMHVVHGDGSGDVNLGIVGFHPSLSHDRSRIVYVAGDGKIWMANFDGSNLSNLTQVTAGSTVEYDPSFSPDDSKLAFTSAASTADGIGTDVYLTSASSMLTTVGHWKKLTSADSPVSSPKLTPDGTGVVFQYGTFAAQFDQAEIARVDASKSNQQPGSWQYLTTPVDKISKPYVVSNDGTPDVSADGTKIAYQEWHSGARYIYTMDADGTHKKQLTDSYASLDEAPAWGPGSRIVFSSNRPYSMNLFVMNADGSGLVSLTGTTGQALTPSWQ